MNVRQRQADKFALSTHPDNDKTAEENAEMYLEILPFAKECGVKIATENMRNWDKEKNQSSFAACATGEDFKKHIDIINDEFFVACLDIGHGEMRGSGNGAANVVIHYRLVSFTFATPYINITPTV